MPERDGAEPVDADMDAVARVATRQTQVLTLWRTATDEHGVEAVGEQRLQALYGRGIADVDTEPRDVANLLVEHRSRQTKRRNIRAHETAGAIQRLENDALIAERHEIVGHGQRSAAGAYERDAFAVARVGRTRQAVFDVAAIVRGHA